MLRPLPALLVLAATLRRRRVGVGAAVSGLVASGVRVGLFLWGAA